MSSMRCSYSIPTSPIVTIRARPSMDWQMTGAPTMHSASRSRPPTLSRHASKAASQGALSSWSPKHRPTSQTPAPPVPPRPSCRQIRKDGDRPASVAYQLVGDDVERTVHGVAIDDDGGRHDARIDRRGPWRPQEIAATRSRCGTGKNIGEAIHRTLHGAEADACQRRLRMCPD